MPCLLLLVAAAAATAPARLLGRSPVENVLDITAGCFTSPDTQQVLVAEDLGRLALSSAGGPNRGTARLFRLALLGPAQVRLARLWQSEPLLGLPPAALRLNPQVWTVADIDADNLLELIIVSGDSCRIVNFGPDSVFSESGLMPGSRAIDAVACDMDGDSWLELVTLEIPADSAAEEPAIRVWQLTLPELQPRTALLPLPVADSGLACSLLGAAILDDYPGRVVVGCAEHHSLRPSRYFAAFAAGPDSFAVTANPFPLQEWFRRDEVLPAGRLSLFNVGDTLVAWGYFVPGLRPTGPDRSFAALQDGAWRLLELTPAAGRLAGQVCRFTWQGVPGWLELSDDVFRFYPGEIFSWR